LSQKYTVDETGPRITALLNKVIQHADWDLAFVIEPGNQELATEFESPDILVKFSGRDVDLLLANRAELLLALELITMEMLRMHSDEHSRVSFDANDYRALRIEELRMSAMAAAEKVKHTGQPFHFNPMNSRERRVIHIALRNETEIRSESSGSGPFRGVIVYPAGMPSLPEPPAPPPGAYRGGGGGPRGFNRPLGGNRAGHDRRGGPRPGGRPDFGGRGGGRPSGGGRGGNRGR
jgi:spoIIIJ-associated protein